MPTSDDILDFLGVLYPQKAGLRCVIAINRDVPAQKCFGRYFITIKYKLEKHFKNIFFFGW